MPPRFYSKREFFAASEKAFAFADYLQTHLDPIFLGRRDSVVASSKLDHLSRGNCYHYGACAAATCPELRLSNRLSTTTRIIQSAIFGTRSIQIGLRNF